MRSRHCVALVAGALAALSAHAHAECVKSGDMIESVVGKLLYGKPWLDPGQTFPDSAQRGRAGNYYMRPTELMCLDKGDGEPPAEIDYLWIEVLRLEETVIGNMQGWINTPVKVAGVVSLETGRTGATAKVKATNVALK